jgi:hypothetical protein
MVLRAGRCWLHSSSALGARRGGHFFVGCKGQWRSRCGRPWWDHFSCTHPSRHAALLPSCPPPQERKAQGVRPEDSDLLSHLLRAQQQLPGLMTDKQIRDELMT